MKSVRAFSHRRPLLAAIVLPAAFAALALAVQAVAAQRQPSSVTVTRADGSRAHRRPGGRGPERGVGVTAAQPWSYCNVAEGC